MTSLAHSAAVVTAIELALRALIAEAFSDAGLGDIPVGDNPATAPFALMPYRVYPWPRVADTPANVSLLGPQRGDRAGVPESWQLAGQLASTALEAAFVRAGRVERLSPVVPLAQLPTPLRAWYEAMPRGAEDDAWITPAGLARVPTLEWRPDFTMRAGFLGFARPDHPQKLLLPTLATLAGHQHRTLRVRVPPRPAPSGLSSLFTALAAGLDGEAKARLLALATGLFQEGEARFSLLLQAEAADADTQPLLRALATPALPCVHLMVQFAVGGGPLLQPGAAPSVQAAIPPREIPS